MARVSPIRISPGMARKIKNISGDAIGRDMMRRGVRVQSAAKKRLSANPKRVDTGRLRSSVRVAPTRYRGYTGARVGTNVNYALLVHNGTGIYGPRRRPIRPKRRKFLRFETKGGDIVYARQVKGMRPNPFLVEALPAARG